MSKLAINGGEKVRTEKFPAYKPIGKEELEHSKQVFKDSIFSRFNNCFPLKFQNEGSLASTAKEGKSVQLGRRKLGFIYSLYSPNQAIPSL